MSVLLDELKALVPPPAAVAPPPWWISLERVGLEFPADYREFVDTYGAGTFEDPERIGFNVEAPHVNALGLKPWGRAAGFEGLVGHHVDQVRPLYDGVESMWSGEPYPLYPDAGGLFEWGSSGEGDAFFWLIQGADPDRWPVVGWSRHDASTILFEGGMVEFLLALFTGRVDHFGPWHTRGMVWEMEHDWLHRNV